MATIILHDEDVFRLAASVNAKQGEGYAPAGGILYSNGLYIQPMATGDATDPYVIVREQETQNFAAKAVGSALGSIQFVDGFFIQAFGTAAGGGGPTSVAWGDVTGKPSTFAPIVGTTANQAMAGNKTLANIGGVVPTSGLPTASTTAAGIIQIGTTATNAMAGNTAITAIGGTLSIAKGGTGATTAANAWTALGGGAVGKLAALPQGTAVPDAAAGTEVDTVNALLASLRAAGYIAS